MQTIEQAAELHAAIAQNAPHPGAIIQRITPGQGTASNQEAHSLSFVSCVAPHDVQGEARRSLAQGFGCVEVVITAKWGGCNHDGSPRMGTEVDVHVLDRLAGGMAQRTWHTRGVYSATALADADVLPLLRSLLGMESLDVVQARQKIEQETADAELQEWYKIWGFTS